MNEMQEYLIDEFVDDYREGSMGRREFVLKIVGVCGGVAAAMAVLSPLGLTQADVALAQTSPAPQPAPARNPVTVSPEDPEISVSVVQFPSTDDSVIWGYLATPSWPGLYPSVVVIHENRGLNDHTRDIARRYAKQGFAALSIDLLSREGGTDANDPMRVPGLLSGADILRHVDDVSAAGTFLRSLENVHDGGYGVTGFCFGGGIAWRTAVRDRAVLAAAPYYGIAPPLDEAARAAHSAMIGMYGANDTRINASAGPLADTFDANGVWREFHFYEGAGHAFFNDTGASYHAPSAMDAWERTLAWFRAYLPAPILARAAATV